MQYFKPAGDFFLGDCMPFAHDGVFHLFYLLDEGHHRGLGGLGGHQWAHATTTDLVHWKHHPLALPISADWEGSICTGSVFYHAGIYHAFYATRMRDWSQHLGHAISQDGIHIYLNGMGGITCSLAYICKRAIAWRAARWALGYVRLWMPWIHAFVL